jgi:hypothetical protein
MLERTQLTLVESLLRDLMSTVFETDPGDNK